VSGDAFGPPLEVPTGGNAITGVAAVTTADGCPIAVAGVHHVVWPGTSTPPSPASPHSGATPGWIAKVAAVRGGDGRVVAVSGGSADRSMRIWEIDPEAHRANNRGEPSVEALATRRPARLLVVCTPSATADPARPVCLPAPT
jgi:hypothetical protein